MFWVLPPENLQFCQRLSLKGSILEPRETMGPGPVMDTTDVIVITIVIATDRVLRLRRGTTLAHTASGTPRRARSLAAKMVANLESPRPRNRDPLGIEPLIWSIGYWFTVTRIYWGMNNYFIRKLMPLHWLKIFPTPTFMSHQPQLAGASSINIILKWSILEIETLFSVASSAITSFSFVYE